MIPFSGINLSTLQISGFKLSTKKQRLISTIQFWGKDARERHAEKQLTRRF
jgi:hypothetical protein